MPRGVEFTDQQRSVLSQIMRSAWERHRGRVPKMTRRWVNPWPKQAGRGYVPGEAVIFRDEVTGEYRRARILRSSREGRQVYYVLDIDYGRIASPGQLRRRSFNPGEAWHRARFDDARNDWINSTEKKDELRAAGRATAHLASMGESKRQGIPNPRARHTKFKLDSLLFPTLIIGAIIWFAKRTETEAAPEPLSRPSPCGDMGDVDGDGFVTENDAKLIMTSRRTLTPDQLRRADVNGDGMVDVLDSLVIAQYAVGDRDTFPVCSMGPA